MPVCRACGSRCCRMRPAGLADRVTAGPDHYALAECCDCGSAVTITVPGSGADLAPRPATPDPGLYEGHFYAPTRGFAERLIAPLRSLVDRDRARVCGPVGEGERVLEIGCGDGALLARLAAESSGVEVAGIEPSGSAAERARERGVEIVGWAVEQAEPPGEWDLIVLWHVLEHLPDPPAVLERVRGWLAPGGRIVIAVPNRAGLQARIGGDRWFGQDLPRHLNHLTPAGLERLLDRVGMEPRARYDLIVDQGPLGMWQTLLNRLTRGRNVAFRALKRDPEALRVSFDLGVSLLAGPLLAAVAVLLEAAAGAAGRGGSVAIEAVLRR